MTTYTMALKFENGVPPGWGRLGGWPMPAGRPGARPAPPAPPAAPPRPPGPPASDGGARSLLFIRCVSESPGRGLFPLLDIPAGGRIALAGPPGPPPPLSDIRLKASEAPFIPKPGPPAPGLPMFRGPPPFSEGLEKPAGALGGALAPREAICGISRVQGKKL